MSDGAQYLTAIVSAIFCLLIVATLFGWLGDRREP